MTAKLERFLSIALTVAAVAMAIAVVHRSYLGASTPPTNPSKPTYQEGWREAESVGIRTGIPSAPITVVELLDLECPACRRFEESLREIMDQRPAQVSLVRVSYPLAYHRFALPAARAAECAHATGRFDALVRAIYDKQDSLGIKSWGSFAADAGISDTAGIANCALKPSQYPRIDQGMAFGRKIGITGTPTVLVNGWRFPGTPSKEELEDFIDLISRGETP